MTVSKDWLPASRDEQLAQVKNWGPILSAKGTEWSIPAAVITEPAALATAKHEATRTPVATAQCKTAFEALTAKMRGIKKRYFYVPPLTDPEQLTKPFYRKRKKDVMEFGYNDSRKRVWFAIQIENQGKKGPWGPLVSGLIPQREKPVLNLTLGFETGCNRVK
ncbi:MAG: hypothetical protein LBF75_03775 [Treponema sp.]|jgi:hypothetical protein|nr:hypothetical protein [Treponema sp.]